jgi:uncharacterized protein with HEPN domain
MSKRSEFLYLGDMLDHAKRAHTLLAEVTREQFESDETLQIVVLHHLRIIGETATKVPAETCAAHPEIVWGRIAGMRHKIVRDYFQIDIDVVWDAVTNDLPPLIAALEKFTPLEPPSA